ncbi:MAG: GYF domain-containing protein [Verrucomicrobiota bacterium]
MSTAELPEYQIFSVLRLGEKTPIGPYSQNQLVELLNEGSINATDFVFYEGLEDWTPISDVFDLHQAIANFKDDGQDHEMLTDAFNSLSSSLQEGEDIYYIAVQDLPALSLTGPVRLTSPVSVAITNERICVIHHKMTGSLEFDVYSMNDVCDADKRTKPKEKKGVFSILLNSGERIDIDKLPTHQLDRLAKIAEDLKRTEQAAT